ncbi:MAG TPA: hypothetical protein VFS08_00870 [Gemmatimonadaceae bacterium]|nr:hypothetical protein [Gemmatimonadaceae bacterium]
MSDTVPPAAATAASPGAGTAPPLEPPLEPPPTPRPPPAPPAPPASPPPAPAAPPGRREATPAGVAHTTSRSPRGTYDADAVLSAELAYLQRHRHPEREWEEVRGRLVGLALSGGGIRSATTNLGILQALSHMDVLPMVDYVSTVSGGGYVGACFSSLLSWNGIASPAGSDAAAQAFTFAPGTKPHFTTSWRWFPFRAQYAPMWSQVGRDVVAHLRTHGNFLIARWGMLRRESMRAIGILVTGILYNIALFLVTLFAVAAVYLTGALATVPLMPALFGAPDEAAAPAAVGAGVIGTGGVRTGALPPLVDGDSAVERTSTVPCPAGAPAGATCVRETRTTLRAPTLWERVTHDAGVLGGVAAGGWRDWRAAELTVTPRGWWGAVPTLFRPWIIAATVGALLVLVLYLWLQLALAWYLRGGDASLHTMAASPAGARSWLQRWILRLLRLGRGDSVEDAFERRVLWQLGVPLVLAAIVTCLVLRWATYPRLDGAAQLVWLFAPFALFVGARLCGILVAVLMRPPARWTRRTRSLWGAFQAITMYGWWAALLLGVLPFAAYALRDHLAVAGVGTIGSLLLTRLLASRTVAGATGRFALNPAVRRALLALFVLLLVGFGVLLFAALLAGAVRTWQACGLVAAAVLLLLLLFGRLVDHNKLGPQYFYRDRLAETYLLSELPDAAGRLRLFRDAMEMPLHALHGVPAPGAEATWRNTAPYHLVSAAINLAGSRDLTRKDRKSGYWLFSKLFCGSRHTGYRRTEEYRGGETKLARAVAISGAAASSGIGRDTFFAQAFATVLFNIRLGNWMENPAHARSAARTEDGVFWPAYLWREVTMHTTETERLVNLSDGGHTGDNVGIYPLLERRCKVIVACDAERDPALAFGSLTEALRHAQVDMGIDVDIDLTMLRPDPATGMSRSHSAVGRIHYPERPQQESYLIYLKSSLTGDEPEPVLNYKTTCPDFPHETTADQFFDDAQFESYRALGWHIAEHAFGRWVTMPAFADVQAYHLPRPPLHPDRP